MGADSHKRSNPVSKTMAVYWLLGLTVAYGIAFYLLIKETQSCLDRFGNPFLNFFDRYLACRSVNELGDALAGAFAPVAFLWLAGAVYIQSQELLAQRKELDETQDVMREQLRATREQVEATREQVRETTASTALFREQTDFLRQEQRQSSESSANRQFDELLHLLRDQVYNLGPKMKLSGLSSIKTQQGQEPRTYTTTITFLEGSNRPSDLDGVPDAVYDRIRDIEARYLKEAKPGVRLAFKESRDWFVAVSRTLDDLERLDATLSPDYKTKAARLGVYLASYALREFIQKVDREAQQAPPKG